MKDLQAQKLASMLLDYLRSTSQGTLPPNLVKDLRVAAGHDDKSNNIVITSALPLDSSDKKQLSSFISKTVKGEHKLEYRLNPNLIAGFTLRIGDKLIDTSVVSKLRALREHLATN
jgi:F0F1-type ATP synthase delta subunit